MDSGDIYNSYSHPGDDNWKGLGNWGGIDPNDKKYIQESSDVLNLKKTNISIAINEILHNK